MIPIYFVTSNPAKATEGRPLLKRGGFSIKVIQHPLMEPLSDDLQEVVRAKALEAYRVHRVPLYVEHGGLYITSLGNLPGCLAKLMFTALKEDICELIKPAASREAIARSMIGYCDGARLHFFHGEVHGTIAPSPRGRRNYYYDAYFIPAGYSRTFAEMTPAEKMACSHVTPAYEQFLAFLTNSRS